MISMTATTAVGVPVPLSPSLNLFPEPDLFPGTTLIASGKPSGGGLVSPGTQRAVPVGTLFPGTLTFPDVTLFPGGHGATSQQGEA